MSISKNGRKIQTLEEWGAFGGPKAPNHWKTDRSAKELARNWLAATSPRMPEEVEAILATNTAFGTIEKWSGEPEVKLRFDKFRGETRNTDLLVKARDQYGDFLIVIEGKADEEFGDTVAKTLKAARARRENNQRSRGVDRIEQLTTSLLGLNTDDPTCAPIRYQLLTATAGALSAGIAGQRAVLLVQEFRTKLTNDDKCAANAEDLDVFVDMFSKGSIRKIECGQLYGPIDMGKSDPIGSAVSLFIGKVTVELRK